MRPQSFFWVFSRAAFQKEWPGNIRVDGSAGGAGDMARDKGSWVCDWAIIKEGWRETRPGTR